MAQVFHRSFNTIAKLSLFGAVFVITGLAWGLYTFTWSPYVTQTDVTRDQPVPFSHKHHVSDDGIDCRYCHTSVEQSNFAGIPSTKTCMNCHSTVWADAPILEPVRESFRTDKPIEWTRVHDLPDYVYFDHSIHVAKGIGCTTCHGPVHEMPLMRREQSLYMKWCLDCHRDPAAYIRPRERVFDVHWQPPPNQAELGAKLVEEYHIDVKRLANCYTCHR